jgi:L-asparagine transporter-like permease
VEKGTKAKGSICPYHMGLCVSLIWLLVMRLSETRVRAVYSQGWVPGIRTWSVARVKAKESSATN